MISSFENLYERHEELIDELRMLRETGQALLERVEDVAASIRYMTNNLLDETYHPEMADHLGTLAAHARRLATLSPAATPDESIVSFVKRLGEVVKQTDEAASTNPCPTEEVQQSANGTRPHRHDNPNRGVVADGDQPAAVETGDGELVFSLTQGFHEKRQCPLWMVQLSTRVDKAAYGELKRKASQLGGW